MKIGLSKGYVIYKCMLPNCPHYLSADLIVGRQSVCWKCGNPFMITKDIAGAESSHPLVKPHCRNCTKRRRERVDVPIPEIFPEVLEKSNG